MLPPRACSLCSLLQLLLHCAALRPPSLNLGVTARSLVDSYRTYRSDGRVEPLEEFVASAVAAFRCAYSLDVVLMELDLAEEASSEDRTARRAWLRPVRTTLTTVDTLGDDAAATPTDALAERVGAQRAARRQGREGRRLGPEEHLRRDGLLVEA